MKGILQSIRKRPLNIILIFIGAMLYLINNLFLKENLPRTISWFFTGYFNDLICPLIFFSYANMLLLTTGRELQRLFFCWLLRQGPDSCGNSPHRCGKTALSQIRRTCSAILPEAQFTGFCCSAV